ncbi:MAG: hypothetical protein JWO48_2911, partial [Bryobacterales bacterium]|nr:hypothetical protein [Bryobacterales bacterium]
MIFAYLASIACLVIVITVIVSHQHFRAMVAKDVEALLSDPVPSLGPEELATRWNSLPEPIQRYLRYSISEGAPAIRTAHLKHGGFFRTDPNQRWLPIQGEEYFTVAKPGFVWNATVRLAPLLWIAARDRLLAGRGNMLVKFSSTFTIANASGVEIDQGASLRWLGEALWFPYAFVGQAIGWEPIDERSARAKLLQHGFPVEGVFEIDEEGKLTRMRAERYRDEGRGNAALTPWFARCEDYRNFAGFHVPS